MNYSNILSRIIEQASVDIGQIDIEKMSFKPPPDKWSKKEILGHLIDSAMNNYQRMLLAQLKDDLIFEGYDQANWVKLNDYQSRDTSEILKIWESLNRHIAQLLKAIPESVLHRKTSKHTFDKTSMYTLSKGEESSLSYLVWDYLLHLEHHLAQIIEGYERVCGDFEG